MPVRRRFVVVGPRAEASADFSLLDLPGTSGRLDVLVRCIRSALLVSHGLRTDTVLYLMLLGGARAPRVVRIDGSAAKFIRPDERALAILLQKTLARELARPSTDFVEVRAGVAIAESGVEALDRELAETSIVHLDVGGADVRARSPSAWPEDVTFVLGDARGLDATTREWLATRGAAVCSVGPVEVHTEDVLALVHNELDRAAHAAR